MGEVSSDSIKEITIRVSRVSKVSCSKAGWPLPSLANESQEKRNILIKRVFLDKTKKRRPKASLSLKVHGSAMFALGSFGGQPFGSV